MIELIVYAALFALVSVAAVDLIADAYAIAGKVRLQRKINTQADLAMQRMIREIRAASAINEASSALNSTPGALNLTTFSDADGTSTTTADFRVIGGNLRFSKATTTIDLTNGISIDRLLFRVIENGAISRNVRVELRLTATTSRYSITNDFYGTAILRGSY